MRTYRPVSIGLALCISAFAIAPAHAFKIKIPNPVKVVKSAVKTVESAPKTVVKTVKDAPKTVVNTAKHAGDAVTHPGRTIEGVGKGIKQTAKDASHGKFKPATVMAVAVPGSAALGVAGSGPSRGVVTSGSSKAVRVVPKPPARR